MVLHWRVTIPAGRTTFASLGEPEPARLFTPSAAVTFLTAGEPVGALIGIEPGLQFHYWFRKRAYFNPADLFYVGV